MSGNAKNIREESLAVAISIAIILLVSFVARLYYFFDYHEIWWDSAVYIEMGKYIFSLGKIGLWEPIRPILWPLFLGFIWFLKLDVFLFGRATQLFLSLSIVYLLYDVTARIYSKRAAILAAAIFSFSSIFFYLGFHLYVEIPAVFFLLLSIFLLIRNNIFLAGIAFALSILTKFPMLTYTLSFIVFFLTGKLWDRAKLKIMINKLLHFGIGMSLGLIPFLVFNFFMYHHSMLPFVEAHNTILRVLGCNLLYYKPWYFYLQMMLKENVLYLLVPFGIYVSLRYFTKEKILLVLSFILPLIYFSQLHCRDYRYMIILLPFAAICAGAYIDFRTKNIGTKLFYLMTVVIFCVSAVQGINFYVRNESKSEIEVSKNYYHFLDNKTVSKEIWVSNPIVGVYTNARVYTIYYPIYDQYKVKSFHDYVYLHLQNISYIFLDTCGGGIICHPSDKICINQSATLLSFLQEEFKLVYNKEHNGCFYYIFSSESI